MSEGRIFGAVLGSPVTHSLSPLLHRAIFASCKREIDYTAIEVSSGTLKTFLRDRSSHFDYFSLTMPLKEEALSLDVEIDPLVNRIQSANTLIKKDGQWKLYSTDGYGFTKALAAAGRSAFNSVLVLGAGGTARAVVGALDGVAKAITVLGRTSTRSAVLENAVSQSSFTYLRWSDSPDFAPYDIIVNTTPAGAADTLANSVIDSRSQNLQDSPVSPALFFDVIYKPWPTVLASRWSDAGGEVINGIELLLYQGIAQAELILGIPLDYEKLATDIRPILKAALK